MQTNFRQILSLLVAINLSIPASIANGAVSRSSEIIRWETLEAEKGFILSTYLYNEQGCSMIWEKQLPEFQKRNPHVEDPDVISKGTKILVQLCQEKDKLKLAKNSSESQDGQNSIDSNENSSNSESLELETTPYLHLYGGFLTENERFDKVDSAYGIGISGDLLTFLGYNMRLLGSSGAMFLQSEARFKTQPARTRGHFIIGLGNRIGLQNKELDRMNKGVDSFTYAGFGLEMNPHHKFRFGLDLTSNVGRKFGANIGVSAQKRLGDDYWLGVFGEYGSSRSMVDEESDRRFFTGGVKFSF